MPDREKVNGFELCANGEPCIGEKFTSCPFSPRNNAEQNCGVTMARFALALLKEQNDAIEKADSMLKIAEDKIKELLKEQEAVVRCKDCKHWWYGNYCDKHGKGQENADWFCADGERRTE